MPASNAALMSAMVAASRSMVLADAAGVKKNATKTSSKATCFMGAVSSSPMNRRALLKAGGLAMAGFAWPACRTGNGGSVSTGPQRPPLHLAVPRISWDRVLRTTVGLRPHRDSGFVLRAEKLDAKTLIHNYGHAGAGMSIGVGLRRDGRRVRAADRAAPRGGDRVRLAGPDRGAPAAAPRLRRHDLRDDGAARHHLEHVAGRVHADDGAVNNDQRTPAWDAQFLRVAENFLRELQLMVGRTYGRLLDGRLQRHRRPESAGTGARRTRRRSARRRQRRGSAAGVLRPNRTREVLGPGEHPFPTKYAIRTPALSIEPNSISMRWCAIS